MKKIILKILILFTCVFTLSFSLASKTLSYAEEQLDSETSDNISELKIKFFPLKNSSNVYSHGDCCIITYGDIQILIDSGFLNTSARDSNQLAGAGANKSIEEQIQKSIKGNDDVWDYVIVTHGDGDHLGAFSTKDNYNEQTFLSDNEGVFKLLLSANRSNNNLRKIGTLIDFDDQNNPFYGLQDQLLNYKRYTSARDFLCKNKYINQYLTSYQCTKRESGISLGKDTFIIDLVNNLSLKILYNDFTFNLKKTGSSTYTYTNGEEKITLSESCARNVISVSCLLTYKTQKFLFTGDLEEYDSGRKNSEGKDSQIFGESKLYEFNKDDLNGGVTFYKAAHHGSKTSNSEAFMNLINPKYIVIPACAGGKFGFPSGEVLNRLLSCNDSNCNVYIPSKKEGKPTSEYYGAITITSNGDNTEVTTSNNLGNIINTEWYKNFMSLRVFTLSGFENETNCYVGNCSIIKYMNTEIVIDCGIYGNIGKKPTNSYIFGEKIKEYCTDMVIDYLIVTSPYVYSISQLAFSENDGTDTIKKGLLYDFTINNIIDYGSVCDPSNKAQNSFYSQYNAAKLNLSKTTTYNYTSAINAAPHIKADNNLYINILKNKYYENKSEQKHEVSLSLTIEFCGKKLLFVGPNSETAEKDIANNKSNDFKNIIYYNVADNGSSLANTEYILNKLDTNKKELYVAINSTANERVRDGSILKKELCDKLINLSDHCYLTCEMQNNGSYNEVCGDMVFTVVPNKDNTIVDSYNMKCVNAHNYDAESSSESILKSRKRKEFLSRFNYSTKIPTNLIDTVYYNNL